jgi:beta-glucosidase
MSRHLRQLLCTLSALTTLAAIAGTVHAQATASAPARPSSSAVPADAPYKNPALPFDQRVADLLSRMTLREKADQIINAVPANSRLGIPAVDWWSEAIHGMSRAGTATCFPQAIAMASAWDPPLLQQVGDAIADEARVKFRPNGQRYCGIMLWSPTINMARDPRWGRTEETYGEDPYLTGRLAVAMVKGLQGDDPKYLKTVATPKHFAMYSQETNRHNTSFTCPEAVLRDYYLPAFHDAFVEGKATSTMSAFNGINKIPASANFGLLTDVLRREWGFQGAVVTDWGAVTNLYDAHHYVASDVQAVVSALNAGVDVICDQRTNLGATIVSAINQNMLKEDVLDRALSRNLLLRFRLGMFDPPAMVPFKKTPATDVGSKEHLALALKMAQESFVLLKNDPAPKGFGFGKPLLPLDVRRIDSIAVLGPYANMNQFGAYSPDAPAGPTPTILSSLRGALGDRIIVRTENSSDTDASIKAAQASDVVLFVCGLNRDIDKEGADRPSILLPTQQQALLEKVVKANPVTIVLLEGGNSIGLAWMKEHVPAIMMIWYPGELGSTASVQMLLGKVNPSGHLPLTFYNSNSDLLPLNDYDITKGRTYQYFQKPTSYVFGHGLSFTAFDYAHLRVSSDVVTADGSLTVNLDVTNSGPMDGDEIVQVYVHEIQPTAATAPTSATAPATATAPASKRPLKQLKAFQRLAIPKGQSVPVTFTIPIQNLGFWDTAAKKYVPEPGRYELLIGRSSEDIRLKAQFAIK